MARVRTDADKIRAGLFVLVALAAAFTIVLILAGAGDALKARTRYQVFFPLQTSTEGLEAEAPVLVNGRPVGVVKRIRLELDSTNNLTDGVYAEILVDKKITFYGEPIALLNRPLLGAGATINFPTVGSVGEAPVAPEGATFPGMIAPPGFLAQAGYGPEQQNQLQDILRRGSQLAEELEQIAREFRDEALPDLRAMVSTTRERLDGWFATGDRIVGNIDGAVARFPGIAQSVEEGVRDARAMVTDARSLVEDNRERVSTTLENARAASERMHSLLESFERDTKPAIDAMVLDAQRTAESARAAVERADALLAESSPALRRTVASARLAADQLKFTLEEVRRAPWRLLYRPDTRELEFELLYDSARIYAQAVSDLRDASAALEAASDAAEARGRPLSPAQAAEMGARLDRAFQSYEQAERAFLDLVIGQRQRR
ncbi:MAG: hypothetical protein KF684_10735 [Phycisphaeraceae bacterium]|nr:hypothetical protein [Phycisphaeraceae bacterium]